MCAQWSHAQTSAEGIGFGEDPRLDRRPREQCRYHLLAALRIWPVEGNGIRGATRESVEMRRNNLATHSEERSDSKGRL